MWVVMLSVLFFQILAKTGICWQIFVNVPNMTSHVIPCRQMDGHKADICFMQLLCKCILTWTRCKKTGNYLICFNICCPEIRILNFATYYFCGHLQLLLSETTGKEQLQSFGVRETKGCKRSIKIDDNALARKVVVNESCIWGWRIFLFWQRIFEVAVIHRWCQQQQPQWSISVRIVLCFYLFLCSCFISHCMILVLCSTYESLSSPTHFFFPLYPF
jgi:hypothetical protein